MVGMARSAFVPKLPSVELASSVPVGIENGGAVAVDADVPFNKSEDVIKFESVLGELLDPCGEVSVSGEESCCVEEPVCEEVLDSGDDVEIASWGEEASSRLEPAPGP